MGCFLVSGAEVVEFLSIKMSKPCFFLSVLNFYLNVISGSNSGLVSGLPSASSFAFYLNFFFNNNFLLLTEAKTTKLR